MNNKWNKMIYKFWSPFYDLIFNKGIFLSARKQVFQDARFMEGKKVLFVGVGTGADLELIQHLDINLTAIDYSDEMLEKARSKFKQSSIKFIQMDGQNMEFENESFDYVVGSLILSVVPNAEKCFEEMLRVLRNKGKIIIFDKFVPKDQQLSIFKRVVKPFIKVLGTDIGLRFEKVVQNFTGNIHIEEDCPLILNGMYRKIIVSKLES
ncbi:class I SAM-dependent methyltransferase [Bacillus sp. 31A1R]|uniref:Class I SAM-dependent methyltransferase n=1 Tax=Robertmurraya mangrovi TaxID=3098077 RepID=A0ABU5IWG7_9BACI|nr:class I SAM-dependent methyltransferase [Bacillus sp. 31A1R]MDZ5471476.1 class I SAM-dependent methyltransferase [Bacillus sp. 31A1R]